MRSPTSRGNGGDWARRHAADDRIGLNVARHHRAGADHRAVADRDARQDDRAVADPRVVADSHFVVAPPVEEVSSRSASGQ